MQYDKFRLLCFAVEEGIIGFPEKPVKLNSGRESEWYVNWRKAAKDVCSMDFLTDVICFYIIKNKIDVKCIYGVPEGATPTALLATMKIAQWKGTNFRPEQGEYSLAMGRGRPKNHGSPEDMYFICKPEGRTLILEDVTTTGDSLLRTIELLESANVEIAGTLSITDRLQKRNDGKSVEEAVRKAGYIHHALTTGPEMIKLAYDWKKIDEEKAEKIEKEFEKYGITPLTLR